MIIFWRLQTRERKPRESILRAEFANAIEFINKDLSEENRLKFLHWDLHKHSRRYLFHFSSFDFQICDSNTDNIACNALIFFFQQSYKCVGTTGQGCNLCFEPNWVFLLSINIRTATWWAYGMASLQVCNCVWIKATSRNSKWTSCGFYFSNFFLLPTPLNQYFNLFF